MGSSHGMGSVLHSELLIVEMTVVARPLVLDFAGAYLDQVPEFPAGVLEDWEAAKQEQFGPVGSSWSRSFRTCVPTAFISLT